MELVESGVWEIVCESGQRLTLELGTSTWRDGQRSGRFDYTRTSAGDKSWTAAVTVEPGRPLYVYDGSTSEPVWSSPSPVVSVVATDPGFVS